MSSIARHARSRRLIGDGAAVVVSLTLETANVVLGVLFCCFSVDSFRACVSMVLPGIN